MKLTFFSDTHGKHKELEEDLGSGDILIHTGDFTGKGDLLEVKSFAEFVGKQNFKYKIVIAGNHDFSFEDKRREKAENYLKTNGIIYLNDSGTSIEGLRFWGSPIQPEFYDWAFNRKRGEEIRKHWDLIPGDTDVLLTHGPPFGIMDMCDHGERVGCEDLLLALKRVKPRFHAFGHIHEGYDVQEIDGVTFVNSCSLDERYEYKNRPISLIFSNLNYKVNN